jgi:hypothetical protein
MKKAAIHRIPTMVPFCAANAWSCDLLLYSIHILYILVQIYEKCDNGAILLKKIWDSLGLFINISYLCTSKTGKSYTASSLRTLQGLIAAEDVGRSGAM